LVRFRNAIGASTVLALTVGLSAISFAPSASATPSASIAVRESAGTLAGTTVSGLSASTHLKVVLTVSSGVMTFDPNSAAGVTIGAGSASGGSSLVLLGNQNDLNQAFDTVNITACGANLTIAGAVVDTDQTSQLTSNGHAYRFIQVGHNLNWHDAKDAAAAMSYDNTPGAQHGYLATITSQAESDFITNLVLGENSPAWIGAADQYNEIHAADPNTIFGDQYPYDVTGEAVYNPVIDDFDWVQWPAEQWIHVLGSEGHWHWVTGPEAGQRFFDEGTGAGTGARDGAFTNWNPNEPNNHWDENVGMVLPSNAKWNDKYEYTSNQIGAYIVEFGGMPGNALDSSSASATYTRPFLDPCATTEPVVTVTAGLGGQAAVSDFSDQVGDHKVITPVPDPGFSIADVMVDGNATPLTNGAVTLTNVLADHTVHVSFSRSPVSHSSPKVYEGPTVLSSYPKTSTLSGGTRLTIEGTNWSTLVSVEVDGKPAQIASKSNTQVQIVIPPHAEGRASATFRWAGGTLIFMDVLDYKNPNVSAAVKPTKTISCSLQKGKGQLKLISGVKPVCPKGYKTIKKN
jgi:hypothetical protein